jgi:cytochrome P450
MFFLHVVTSPTVYAKLRSELDQGIQNSAVSSPIKDSEARQLPYLQACIKETLGICPPIVGMLQKETPPEGDTIGSMAIPGGTLIGSVYFICQSIHNNP